jgi:hypothetical protein
VTQSGKKDAGIPQNEPDKSTLISRRSFIKGAGVVVAGSIGLATTGCQPGEAPASGITGTPLPTANQYPAVPYPPAEPPPDVLKFFTPHEARTVEALTARILPGTPDDPGAQEAGVVYYIDNLLAYNEGFAEAVYRQPPFVQTYEGDSPPEEADLYQVIWVPASEIERYGYQSTMTPREVFRLGLAAVDRYASEQFDSNFVDLSEAEQDEIIGALANNEATGFEPLNPEQFFHVLRRYTGEGMFSDPAYGGNRNMVGWKLIGYPGAQRAYTPADVRTEGTSLEPQSLAQLHAFNPGQPVEQPNVVLPVRGSEHNHRGE